MLELREMDHSDDIGVENIIREMLLRTLRCEDVEGTHLAQDSVQLFAVVELWCHLQGKE
jgi:hypothetical protein